MNLIDKISIAGYGNVGYHLARHFHKKGINITHLFGKINNQSSALSKEVDAKLISSISDLPKDQLLIICIPDGHIKDLLEDLDPSVPAAYTAGAVDINELPKRANLGVFYPLQTFSRIRAVDISRVPFFIEGSNSDFEETLLNLAHLCSDRVHLANSETRKDIHLSAVWVNNFVNHIMYIAKKYAEKNDLNFEYFKPLLSETLSKLDLITPYEAQTGPARRNDIFTIKEQLAKLEETDQKIYNAITESIQETYGIK